MAVIWKLNTSNQGKFEEFKRLFAIHGIELDATHIDLDEIDDNLINVVAHKASQLDENVIVEDTSLNIEGAQVGTQVRFLLDHLEEYVGKKAEWIVLLAYRIGNNVRIFKGSQEGMIVKAQGAKGFGFDPVFMPTGSDLTLAEAKPDHVNARAKAVDAFIKQVPFLIHPAIYKWEGRWQKKSNK